MNRDYRILCVITAIAVFITATSGLYIGGMIEHLLFRAGVTIDPDSADGIGLAISVVGALAIHYGNKRLT